LLYYSKSWKLLFKTPLRFDILLEEAVGLGLTIHPDDPPSDTDVMLGLDGNYMQAPTGDGEETVLYRWGENDPTKILELLSGEFGEIFSEHDEGY